MFCRFSPEYLCAPLVAKEGRPAIFKIVAFLRQWRWRADAG
jgi:hypothetical protein